MIMNESFNRYEDMKAQLKVKSRYIQFYEKHGMGTLATDMKKQKTDLEHRINDEKIKSGNRKITKNKQLKQLRGEIL